MSEIGFDDGALMNALSTPIYDVTNYERDDEGNIIKKKHWKLSLFTLIIAVGGPAMLYGFVLLFRNLQNLGVDVDIDAINKKALAPLQPEEKADQALFLKRIFQSMFSLTPKLL